MLVHSLPVRGIKRLERDVFGTFTTDSGLFSIHISLMKTAATTHLRAFAKRRILINRTRNRVVNCVFCLFVFDFVCLFVLALKKKKSKKNPASID